MSTNYPTSLDTFTNPTATSPQNSPSHSAQHTNINDAVAALQAKVGINSSAVTASVDYQLANNFALLAGRSGGQVLIGGTGSGESLTLKSTSHATKGLIQLEGTTSSFTALKNNSGVLDVKLADNSAYAQLQALELNIADASNAMFIRNNGGTGFTFGNYGSVSPTGARTVTALIAGSQGSEGGVLGQYWSIGGPVNGNAGTGTWWAKAKNQLMALSADTTTNTTSLLNGVDHRTSGTAAAGFGASYEYCLQSSTTAGRAACDLTTLWATATDASRKARFTVNVYDTASRECIRCEASGTVAMVGFFGATAVVQPAGTGETTGFTAGAGTAVNDASTFTGNVGSTAYRISDIVKALKQLGLLAQ